MDFVAVRVFQAVGHGRSALAFAILRMIVLEIPALYVYVSVIRTSIRAVCGGACAVNCVGCDAEPDI